MPRYALISLLLVGLIAVSACAVPAPPTPTPLPPMTWEETRDTMTEVGVLALLHDEANEVAFYTLIAKCGGPDAVREQLILKAAIPPAELIQKEGLYFQRQPAPLPNAPVVPRMSEDLTGAPYEGAAVAIIWDVVRYAPDWAEVEELFASGTIASDCAVATDAN